MFFFWRRFWMWWLVRYWYTFHSCFSAFSELWSAVISSLPYLSHGLHTALDSRWHSQYWSREGNWTGCSWIECVIAVWLSLPRRLSHGFITRSSPTTTTTTWGRKEEEKVIFLFPSSRASRSCRAPREISRSPRLAAHKAPVRQAKN